MVSFVCNYCQETLKKAKLDPHTQRCRNATFSCIDCSVDFAGTAYREHTSCISETEKYQGKMKKAKPAPRAAQKPASAPQSTVDQLVAKAQQIEDAIAAGSAGESSKRKRDSGVPAWDSAELPADTVDALVAALAHACASEPGVAFGDLKKKCIRMVAKHPKATASKSEAKSAFDRAVLAALVRGVVALSA
ncbi:hypothetical protein IWQ57_002334 [Coemansia nantahalensis]|uniref:Uncharacterized protein n=1 Tax=Coemansia nantahalensis TaxID=2789366 RepID=A0ACC1K101_9FUNG|nr:hypothetical protein IWQ57_002334 [Coemansia nantahalensis]